MSVQYLRWRLILCKNFFYFHIFSFFLVFKHDFIVAYKILNTTQPSYLYDLVSIQPPQGHNTRSSPYVTIIKPSSSLKVTHRSFRHASPHLWNQLPTSLRIPRPNYSSFSQRPSFGHAGLTCYSLLSPSITFSLFHSELKTYLFRKSYPLP